MSDSELSEWASEDDAPVMERPTFKSVTEGKAVKSPG
jgi:hypothetical protein